MEIRQPELAIPWEGLRHEFLMMGMKESSVEAMLGEAKEFERIANVKEMA